MTAKDDVKKLMDEFEPLAKALTPAHQYAPAPDVGRELARRERRAAELSAADLYGLADDMTGPSGHGEGGMTERVIRRGGSWGSGDYPPVFTNLKQAFIEAARLGLHVVPLRYFTV